MKRFLPLAAALALASPAAAQTAMPASPMMAPISGEAFRHSALIGDAFEVESSRLALERSRNPRIQRFAQRMIDDHSMSSQALNGGVAVFGPGGQVAGGAITGAIIGGLVGGPVGAAVGAGVGAGAGATTAAVGPYAAGAMNGLIDARRAAMLNQLASLEGRSFDRVYARMQVAAHREAIGMYRAYAQAGDDPSLRRFAAQVLPTLEEHYAMARHLYGGRR